MTNHSNRPVDQADRPRPDRQRGSALLVALLALVLLTGMGIILLFVTQTDVSVNQTELGVKRVFYGSEAGLERGREALRQWQIASGTISLNDELARAAGANGLIDFDPRNVQPIYDSNGNVTGFTGVGDDEPLRGFQAFDDGVLAAYLTNDPVDARTGLIDTNRRLMVTGIAVTSNTSFEIVEAVVDQFGEIPRPGAAITLLGPNPTFQGGSSSSKMLTGNDCNPPWWMPPSIIVPVVGVIGSDAEAAAELGMDKENTFIEGMTTGADTIDDIEATIDPKWKDCDWIVEFAGRYRAMSDVVGNSATPLAALGTPANPKVVFIDGDYDVPGGMSLAGALWVTGRLEFSGNSSFQGPIFIIGRGLFERDGAGNGDISGGSIVANVSGPDGVLFTSDDCSGDDGVHGTSDDGMGSGADWNVNGSGTGDTIYCSSDLDIWRLRVPFEIVDFRQR